MPTGTRRPSGRCDGCRRARSAVGIGWPEFDTAPLARATRPLHPGSCSVRGCEGDLHSSGLCFRHERRWNTDRAEPLVTFIARSPPLVPGPRCRVAGCDRDSIGRRQLCWFHDNRLKRRHNTATLSSEQLEAWVARERPRLGVHQFSLVGLPEGLRIELLYGLQQRDQAPPPLDPTEVRILLTRLGEAGSLRDADPQAVCESGGTVYNTATRGLFRDLRRHLDRAWAQYTSTTRSSVTCGKWRCWTCASTPPAAGQPPKAWSTSASLNNPGCARLSRTGPAPRALTCSGYGRRCAPARAPPMP